MLDKDQIAAAWQTLREHWRAGSKLAGLAGAMRPRDRAEGYAIQAELEKQSGANLFGWKIAAAIEAGQRHINVAGPMAGRILSDTHIADGGTASMAGNAMPVAEPEFAFRMGPACRRVPLLTMSLKCWMRSTRCIRRSRLRIPVLPISPAPARLS
jgi:2-keto-4-pentenoate hydratase